MRQRVDLVLVVSLTLGPFLAGSSLAQRAFVPRAASSVGGVDRPPMEGYRVRKPSRRPPSSSPSSSKPASRPMSKANFPSLTKSGPALVQDLPWKERLEEARQNYGQVPLDQARDLLSSKEDAVLFVALQRFYDEKQRPPEATLVRLLPRVSDEPTASAIAFHLRAHGTVNARDALAEHVVRKGPGWQKIQERYLGLEAEKLLDETRARLEKKQQLLDTAATGRVGTKRHQDAITSLASIPGDDVTAFLEELSRDLNSTVAALANSALADRRTAGLMD